MSAIGHDQGDIVAGGFHQVRNKGVAETVAGETIGLAIVEFCELGCFAASACYSVVECHYFCSGEEIFAVREAFYDASLDNVSNEIPDWQKNDLKIQNVRL